VAKKKVDTKSDRRSSGNGKPSQETARGSAKPRKSVASPQKKSDRKASTQRSQEKQGVGAAALGISFGTRPLRCFVMMPFGTNDEYTRGNIESNFVFKHIICPGIQSFQDKTGIVVEVDREVDRNVAGSITAAILQSIATSDICIVDITGRNANVFFELGIRYSLRHRVTILLRQSGTEIPFDIRGYKCLTYDSFDPEPAIAAIREFLISGIREAKSVDSLVFETFPDMQVHIPGVVTSIGESPGQSDVLPWDEWWLRVQNLAELLRDPFDNGRFVPSVVLGISNGGLLVADLLGREVFKGVPILSLWANRWQADQPNVDPSCYYFDNEFNRTLLRTIRDASTEGKGMPTVLLVDDLVFTSGTIVQARAFIRRELGSDVPILFTPLFCRDTDYLDAITEMLPFAYGDGETFDISQKEFYEHLTATRTRFPYKKVIGGS